MSIELLDIVLRNAIAMSFDESLSPTELLAAVVAKVNELTAATNTFLDQDLETMVITQLTTWMGDGTIDLIVSEGMQAQIDAILPTISNLIVDVKTMGAIGDGTTDDTEAIQDAIDSIIDVGGTVYFPHGIYKITQILRLDQGVNTSIIGFHLKGTGMASDESSESGSRIFYDGTTAADSALIESGTKNFLYNSISDIELDAYNKLGYCLHLASGDVNQNLNKHWNVTRVTFARPKKICLFIGDNRTYNPATLDWTDTPTDCDAFNNTFTKCIFTNWNDGTAFGGIVINILANSYKTVFNECIFEQGTLSAHYFLYAKNTAWTKFLNCSCLPLTPYVDTAAIIKMQSGDVFVSNLDGEEARVLYAPVPTGAYANNFSLDGFTCNDASLLDSGNAKRVINVPVGNSMVINLKNCICISTLDQLREIYMQAGYLSCENVDIGTRGNYDVVNLQYFSVDNIRYGGIKALNKNWSLSNWQTANLLIGDYAAFVGDDGVQVITRDVANNVIGKACAKIDVTTASTTYLSGLLFYIPGGELCKNGITVHMSGKLTDIVNQRPSILINGTTGLLGGTSIRIKDDGSFTAFATYMPDKDDENTMIMVGLTINDDDIIYIDTIVVAPIILKDEPASHILFSTALPDDVSPIIGYAAAAPSVGTWRVGDMIYNKVPTVGQPKAWVCTVAGTSGTWVSTGNL